MQKHNGCLLLLGKPLAIRKEMPNKQRRRKNKLNMIQQIPKQVRNFRRQMTKRRQLNKALETF